MSVCDREVVMDGTAQRKKKKNIIHRAKKIGSLNVDDEAQAEDRYRHPKVTKKNDWKLLKRR